MATIFRDSLFRGETALVTGGGTGIGLAIARELVMLGADVALCGRRPEPLAAAAEELQALRPKVKVHQSICDIRDPEAVGAFVDAAREALGSLGILVNNAGGQFPTTARQLSPKGFEAVVRNNLMGTWNMTHAAAERAFIPQRRGRIINIIAVIARGFPGMVHTGAARAGVENLTKTLAVEWSQFGIRVNAVAPGVIVSSGTRQYPPQLLHTARQANPLKRLGHPQEVAHLVVYLASPQADFITGQTFTIDGGASLWGEQWPVPAEVPQFPPYAIGDEAP